MEALCHEARALFHNSRIVGLACERRDGDGQQLAGGSLRMCCCWWSLCHGDRLVRTSSHRKSVASPRFREAPGKSLVKIGRKPKLCHPRLKKVASLHCGLTMSQGNGRTNGVPDRKSHGQPNCECHRLRRCCRQPSSRAAEVVELATGRLRYEATIGLGQLPDAKRSHSSC
jgi:hypothetical protein